MTQNEKQRMQDLIQSYKEKIGKELGERTYQEKTVSKEYQEFREEFMPRHLTLYEKLCNLSEKILKIKVNKKKEMPKSVYYKLGKIKPNQNKYYTSSLKTSPHVYVTFCVNIL